ncbi:MAG: hypothetical protein MJY54_01195, partial [archaeon]|nr:hypothetical protein [archaeon]
MNRIVAFNVKIQCSSNTTLLIVNGKLYGMGNNEHGQLGVKNSRKVITPTQIGLDLGTITDITCSYSTTFFIADGKLYGMGDNFYGQLGLG